ncbi:MAG: undecaprenyl/decaprenyl-phosphate alpha-N-acetylglucosaminyl 1-phosphate transferase [Planctomycetaceae bacterium]|nr:undecaprenyl/decaprenyl-phosphate alpha-N-acetylglucosaminyl 1-phosphate transferase [Planctomycetaceae bacterium]
MTGVLAAFFIGSFVAALLSIPALISVAKRANFLDQPGPRKIHTAPVPYGGGLAVALGVLGSAAVYLWAIGTGPGGEVLSRFVPVDRSTKTLTPQSLAIYMLASLVILVLGLVDDRKRLSARHKLLVQAIVAAGVATFGQRLQLFDAPAPVGIAVTVLWILAVTNAFNLLDHMDGLSSGVALLSGAAFLVVALQTGQTSIACVLIPLLGACTAFLIYNFPPARMFLGDAGSLFIGFWLSCLTVSFTFYEARYPLYTYFTPLAILAVPLFDTAVVILLRLFHHKPVFEGDTNHFAHRLTALGMSRKGAVLTVYALTLTAGLSAVLLYNVEQRGALLILLQLLLTFGIITLLEAAGRRHDA